MVALEAKDAEVLFVSFSIDVNLERYIGRRRLTTKHRSAKSSSDGMTTQVENLERRVCGQRGSKGSPVT